MDNWKMFNETTLPEKEEFYRVLQMRITCIRKEF